MYTVHGLHLDAMNFAVLCLRKECFSRSKTKQVFNRMKGITVYGFEESLSVFELVVFFFHFHETMITVTE